MFSVSASVWKLAARWGSEPGNSSARPLDQAAIVSLSFVGAGARPRHKKKKAGGPAFWVLRGR